MVTKGSVLVVDDEINLCRILGAKLAKSGYDVVAVHDGLQAVEKVRESEFDVVLLDLILPKMDGLTALAEIRSLRSALPVIVMTACENAEALAQAKSYGVSGYVNKPFDLDNLVSLVAGTSLATVADRQKKLPTATVLFGKDQPLSLDVQNGSQSRAYHGRIYDKDDRTLSVCVPRSDDETAEIPPRVSVRCGLAAVDAYYSFSTQILRIVQAPVRVLVLDKPSVIYRAQRRQHTRVPMKVPVEYAVLSSDSGDSTPLRRGDTIDLSLGGAMISVPDEILPGEMLKIELRPKTSKDKASAVAHVLRSRPANPGEAGYVLGCKFTQSDESLRKLLER